MQCTKTDSQSSKTSIMFNDSKTSEFRNILNAITGWLWKNHQYFIYFHATGLICLDCVDHNRKESTFTVLRLLKHFNSTLTWTMEVCNMLCANRKLKRKLYRERWNKFHVKNCQIVHKAAIETLLFYAHRPNEYTLLVRLRCLSKFSAYHTFHRIFHAGFVCWFTVQWHLSNNNRLEVFFFAVFFVDAHQMDFRNIFIWDICYRNIIVISIWFEWIN